MEWLTALLPKSVRTPLAILALVGLAIGAAFQGFFILEAHAEETAKKTVQQVINTEVTAQIRTEAKNAAVEAAVEATREAVTQVARNAAVDQDFILQRQAKLEARIKELEQQQSPAIVGRAAPTAVNK